MKRVHTIFSVRCGAKTRLKL